MNNLFILYETYTDGYKADILDIISLSAILCGIFVIISKNPIVSVLFLIGLFASISCYLIMLGLSFIGLAYLIVYIGAVVKHVRNNAGLVQIQLYKILLNLMKIFFDLVMHDNPSYKMNSRNRLPVRKLPLVSKKFYSTQSCIDKEYEEFLKWFVGFSDGESNFTIVFQKNKAGDITWASFRFIIFTRHPICHKSALPFTYCQRSSLIRTSIFPNFSLTKKPYSTATQPSPTVSYPSDINPNWITGFTDAEGCFMITLKKQAGKTGWGVQPSFVIHLHSKDAPLLYAIQNFFGGIGKVFIDKKTSASFMVRKLEDIIDVIIPHFEKYPLQSGKIVDYRLWVMCINIIANKEHLTLDGLTKIVSIKSILNKGLSENLKTVFQDVKPLNSLEYKISGSPLDPYWVSGFSEGDSSFLVSISKKNYTRIIYSIGLHARDLPLIYRIQGFFGGAGKIINYKNTVQYAIADFNSIDEILIPHFDTFTLKGNKLNNYLIWREIFSIVKTKSHLTTEGLEKIRSLKAKLNV